MADLIRKIQPAIIPATPGIMMKAELVYLNNGIPVYSINAGEEELVRLDCIFNAGQAYENKPLIASTVSMMLTEGTQNLTAEELNKTLDFYGAVPNFFAEKDSAGLSIAFLTKYSEKILDLCLEILFRPAFPADELEALMKKRLQWFYVSREKVQSVASDKFFESIFGGSHPYGKLVSPEDFTNFDRDHLSRFHSSFYECGNMTIIMAGKIPSTMILLLNRTFGSLTSSDSPGAAPMPVPVAGKPGKIFIGKKDALQTAIRIGSPTINKKHKDYHGLKILDTILGGYFGSRLMKNIREDKGYTYGISSSVVSFNLAACKVIGTEVGVKHTSEAIKEIFAEIKRLQNERIDKAELVLVKNYMLGEMVRMFDGPFATADSFRAVWEFDLDYGYYSAFAEKIKTIGQDEIIHLARTYYKAEDLFEVIVGQE